MPEELTIQPYVNRNSGIRHLNRLYSQLNDSELIQTMLKESMLYDSQVHAFIDYGEMWICRGCLSVNGIGEFDPKISLIYKKYGGKFEQHHHRERDCDDWVNPGDIIIGVYTEYPEERLVDLCWCCAQSTVAAGSRFSRFFCPNCHDVVRDFNEAASMVLIPVGRHSWMNGISGQLAPGQSTAEFASIFTKAALSMNTRIARVRNWRKLILHDLLMALGLDGKNNIQLVDHDRALRDQQPDVQPVFQSMVEFIYGHRHSELTNVRMPYTGTPAADYYEALTILETEVTDED